MTTSKVRQTSLRLPEILPLDEDVRALLHQVPPGKVTTYGALARAIGDVRAARWVAQFLNSQQTDRDLPWHRVVSIDGSLARNQRLPQAEQWTRLRAEGIVVHDGQVRLAPVIAPLTPLLDRFAPLLDFQHQVASRVQLTDDRPPPQYFCGLDVAYPTSSVAVGAAVLLESETLAVVRQATCQLPVPFPYIPGYLTFRELPVLLKVWQQISTSQMQDVLCVVDGNGRLHPRRAGVASCFGVLTNQPTIGVSKSLLCGRVQAESPDLPAAAPIIDEDEQIGAMLAHRDNHPLYASVGHRVSLPRAIEITRHCLRSYPLPDPTWYADWLSHHPNKTCPTTPGEQP